jgi:hypothetical protein
MLQFFSASTNIVNSKRAITECLENALEGQGSLDCDLIIIYSAMGHNFKDLLSEAHKLSPGARIAGCTVAGIIGKNGADETMTALNVMVIKGPDNEFAITHRKTSDSIDSYSIASEMANELKEKIPGITFVQFLPSTFEWYPYDKAIHGIESVFGKGIPVFGGVAIDNFKLVSCFHFFDDEVVERGAIMIGFADPTLKFISRANHGFGVVEGMPFTVTRCKDNLIYELNGQPAWKTFTGTLGIPETTNVIEVIAITGLAKELPKEYHEIYGSKYLLFVTGAKSENDIINATVGCKEGDKLWLTKRDEKRMFEGVDWMVTKVLEELQGKRPVAVFHADCALRGRFSLNRILKDELVHKIQYPICKGENIPWFGLYSGGEFAMIGDRTWFHQITSSLFVIYR